MLWKVTFKAQVVSSSTTGNSWMDCTVRLFMTFLDDTLTPQQVYNNITFYQSGGAGKILYSMANDVGTWAEGVWYNLRLEFDTSTGNLVARAYLDGTLIREQDWGGFNTMSALSVQMTDEGQESGIYSGDWAYRAERDNYRYYRQGLLADHDNFDDGSLLAWPPLIDTGFLNGESGSVYWADDSEGDKHIIRARSITDLIGTGGGEGNAAVLNPKTKEIHHAYLSEESDLICQTFAPGVKSAPVEATVDTNIDTPPNGMVFDAEGKLVIFLADDATTYAAVDPKTASSWGAW